MKNFTLQNLIDEHAIAVEKSKMSEEKLREIIFSLAQTKMLQEETGYVLFEYKDKKMALYCDKALNRMRVISPITSYSILAPKIKDSLMRANFYGTLDARYALADDTLYAIFLHPLSSLAKEDFLSALTQVNNLVINFAKTYSSAQIEFTSKK